MSSDLIFGISVILAGVLPAIFIIREIKKIKKIKGLNWKDKTFVNFLMICLFILATSLLITIIGALKVISTTP